MTGLLLSPRTRFFQWQVRPLGRPGGWRRWRAAAGWGVECSRRGGARRAWSSRGMWVAAGGRARARAGRQPSGGPRTRRSGRWCCPRRGGRRAPSPQDATGSAGSRRAPSSSRRRARGRRHRARRRRRRSARRIAPAAPRRPRRRSCLTRRWPGGSGPCARALGSISARASRQGDARTVCVARAERNSCDATQGGRSARDSDT